MTHSDYARLSQALLEGAHAIETSKRPGYTRGADDVLANFKRVAERTGMTPAQCWGVYFLKHIDAIMAAMTQPELPLSESIDGRFADAVNYLKLGLALYAERAKETVP